jgi:hypothetical protein
MTREKAKVLSHGPMADNTLVNGKVINFTGKELLPGKMQNTLENIKTM